jgi:peptidoglycan hydrolase CwlO-like protein
MQDTTDDERKDILGEVLADELKAISEYVKDVPKIQEEVHQIHAKVDDMNDQIKVFKHVLKEHEEELSSLKHKIA